MTAVAPLLLLGWLAACNPRGEAAPLVPKMPSPSGSASAEPGAPVMVQISSPSDFPRAQAAMSELMWSEKGSPAELRIQLAPGRYEGLADLAIRQDPSAPTPVHLVIQGARSVFDGVGMDLRAAAVDVDGVVFTGGMRGVALQVHTSTTSTLSNLAFVALDFARATSGPARGGALVLDAVADGASARLDGCVFVGSRTGNDVALIAIVAQPSAAWGEVSLTGSVVAGNTFTNPIRAMVVRKLTVDDAVLANPSGPVILAGAPWVVVSVADADVVSDTATFTAGPAAQVADTVRIHPGPVGDDAVAALVAAASAGPVDRDTAVRLLGLTR